MAMSREMQEQFEENRLRMKKLERSLRIYMWIMIFLGATIFCSAFMAGALASVKQEHSGPGIFYNSMSAGVFQLLIGIATVVLGWMTAAKKRAASLTLLGIYFIGIVAILVQKNGTFAAANMIFLLAGIGLNVWAQLLFNENNLLREQPGYPLFSVEASQRAHYEVPLNVRVREKEASKNMETIGGSPAPVQIPEIPQPAPVKSEPAFQPDADGFSNPKPLGPTPSVRRPDHLTLSKAYGLNDMEVPQHEAPPPAAPQPEQPLPQIQLDSLTTVKKTEEAALPQLNAADMLAEMTAIPSHATVQGNPDMLPTPEDVRERLAAMKRARQEHPSDR